MDKLHFSALTKEQLKKILKAFGYSFVSAFAGTFVLVGSDVLDAAQGGFEGLTALLVPLVTGAVVAGINAGFVTVKQLFTEQKAAN